MQISGDLATGTGGGSMIVDIDREDEPMSFKVVDIFRRQDAGWRFSHIIWNQNEQG